jgi:ribonuclease VapC
MVIDTSAIVAAIAAEPDATRYEEAIKDAQTRLISAVTVLETQIVLQSHLGPSAVDRFHELIAQAAITVIPFDLPLANAAFETFRRYGKGRGHRAQLNIIDCVAYALARTRGLPLLFKGNDFAHTDITPALPPGLGA